MSESRSRLPPAAGAQAATGGAAADQKALVRSLDDHRIALQQAGSPACLASSRAGRFRGLGEPWRISDVDCIGLRLIRPLTAAQDSRSRRSTGMGNGPAELRSPGAQSIHRDTMQRRASLLLSLARAWSGSAAASGLGSLSALPAPCSSRAAVSPVLEALQAAGRRWLTAGPVAQAAEREFITLNTLADNPGATHSVRGSAPGPPRQGLAAGAAAAARGGGRDAHGQAALL